MNWFDWLGVVLNGAWALAFVFDWLVALARKAQPAPPPEPVDN